MQIKTYFSHLNRSIKSKKSTDSYKRGYSESKKCLSKGLNKVLVHSDQWGVLAVNKSKGPKLLMETMQTNRRPEEILE